MHNAWLICLAALCTLTASLTTKDWTEQCHNCRCYWSNGRRTADCKAINLVDVPANFSSEIREIDFSDNRLGSLEPEAMMEANLRDLSKLRFRNCSLEVVDRTAFLGLQLLIDLDLSHNAIVWLDKLTFRDNYNLRVLSINHNNLTSVGDGLFHKLAQLQTIWLQHNRIAFVEEKAFAHLPKLEHIDLAFNDFQTMFYDFTLHLRKLNRLNLEGNPWVCDCHLEDFRNKVVKDNLIDDDLTECAEPEGVLWTSTRVFTCVPLIELQSHLINGTLNNGTQITDHGSNVTLTCRVSGEPQPDVEWVKNGQMESWKGGKFTTSMGRYNEYTWINLTITNVDYWDEGSYKCVAKNFKGTSEKKITLVVPLKSEMGYAFYIYDAIHAFIYTTMAAADYTDIFTKIMIVLTVVLLVTSLIYVITSCCCVDAPNGSAQPEKPNCGSVLHMPDVLPTLYRADKIRQPLSQEPQSTPLLNSTWDLDTILSKSQMPRLQIIPSVPSHCYATLPARSRQNWHSTLSSISSMANTVMREPIHDQPSVPTIAWSFDTPVHDRMILTSFANCHPIEEQYSPTAASSPFSSDYLTGSAADAFYSNLDLDGSNVRKMSPVVPSKFEKHTGPLFEYDDEDEKVTQV